MSMQNQKGFTIVELLVVIVVISILVALTLPNLFGLQRRARDTTRKNDIKNVKSALETYYGDNNYYPVDLNTIVSAGLIEADATTDPRSGATYTYDPDPAGCDNTATNCATYVLSADLENDDDPEANGSGLYEVQSVNQ